MSRNITDEERKAIINLYRNGHPVSWVAKAAGRSERSVREVLSAWRAAQPPPEADVIYLPAPEPPPPPPPPTTWDDGWCIKPPSLAKLMGRR